MTAPIANFAGLSSGVQWNDVVDSLITAEEARLVTPITTRLDKRTAERGAWTTFRTMVDKLNDAARAVRVAGFGGYLATAPKSPLSGQTLFGASASTLAEPGRYRVEVLQLAETARLGGKAVADRSAALNLTGDFAINGTSIAIDAADSLQAIRDKINTANAGPTPTGVSASIINDGATGGRLVLTRSTPGASGITLTDGTGGLARELGFMDSRTKPVSSTTDTIAAALGIAVYPPPASIRVGDRVITVDLSTDSIASIVSKINAAGGQASAAEETFGDETRYRLITDGNVTADPGDANSQDVIDALGFGAGTSSAVRQVVSSGALTDAGGAVATTGTALAGLQLNGTGLGLSNGDAINIRGVRGDGTEVSIGIKIDPGETVQDLLDKLNDATSGFGAGTRTATATLGPDGKIRLADATGGSSRLSFSMDIVRADGSTGSMGTSSVETAGRVRELQQGRDAIIRVDGAEFVRSSNNITDAIPNVTLSLTAAEIGTTVDLDIARDVEGASTAAKALVDVFNEVRTFFDEQRQIDAPLYGNTLFRGVVDSFTAALRTEVSDNTTYSRPALVGMVLDRNGGLTFDAAKFKEALNAAPKEIESLFGFAGLGGAFVSATDRASSFSTGTINAQLRTIDESSASLRLREADARRRLEARRVALVTQFSQMEAALSRLNAQGTALSGLTASLQNSRS
jgi:flagellar hook-associated protein 2